MESYIQLKYEKCYQQSLTRNDIILHNDDLWQCVSLQLKVFMNLETRQQQKIDNEYVMKMHKLELIPRYWSVQDNKVTLKGQYLGLGKVHYLTIIAMKQFEYLYLVKSSLQHGKKLDYKVLLCETLQPGSYLLAGIYLLGN